MTDVNKYPLTLPGELYRQIKADAHARDQSVAQWLRQAARDRLERQHAEQVAAGLATEANLFTGHHS